jgi:hypothetical protein
VAAANEYEPSPTSPGERDNLLDFFEGVGLDVEFGARVERSCPSVMEVLGGGSEWDFWVEAVKLDLKTWILHIIEVSIQSV